MTKTRKGIRVDTWRALTVGVCNQAYYHQLILRGWRPDWCNNRAVLWTWERMCERTRVEWVSKARP